MDVKVKICGITRVEDAKAAADAGADAIGFMFFAQSPRAVSIDAAAEIGFDLSPWVMKVGVFVDPEPDFVFAAIQTAGLNLLQFHGNETPEFCSQFGVMSMKALRIKDRSSLEVVPSYHTDALLLDSYVAGKQGGTGEKFNWDLAIEAKSFRKPIFLAGGLTAENVAEAVRRVEPFGVDVSSGVEQAPGHKDHAKIRRFITAVREA
jgi:phosphoribosylanthranilate isomerase